MENILIVDTETNGLDANLNSIIEVGAIFYNVPSRSIIYQISFLVGNAINHCVDINRISQEAINSTIEGISRHAKSLFIRMICMSDAILAHNAQFDRGFLERDEGFMSASEGKPWICTKNDVKWPIRQGAQLNLIHISSELGVPVISAHRALTDCTLLVGCLDKIPDLNEWLSHAMLPKAWYQAAISYDDRHLAKDAGFSWESKTRAWIKRLTEKEADDLPFRVSIYQK